ncbi:Oleate desaturase [Heracleum sosnowskyi]|uniref:Oleate desaturase n=1 Tax=Heracleum sosnowskyi TaxID=360622 RepID=A0AAD8MWW5_9APIA|nr:Oleate desaturase [Heracleum sosnowskyi]
MGAGGNLAATEDSGHRVKRVRGSNVLPRAPHEKPNFTLRDLKKAIPPHCFERSLLHSLAYLIVDFIANYLMYFVASNYFHLLPYKLAYLAWPVYGFCQGCVMYGLWVIGHECGHHGFSDYQWVDDAIGLFTHSLILCPYYAFKITHRRHHANTSNLDREEAYVPQTKPDPNSWYWGIYGTSGRIGVLLFKVTLGWPSYLLFNMAGRGYNKFANHFYPYSPMYSARERIEILISNAGILAMLYALYLLTVAKGLSHTLLAYGIPLLVHNAFLVIVTCFQHTHPSLPRYDSSEWDWFRGALSTVDRDYGILNHVFHHVTDSHVVHHLLSTIPHYHSLEATEAIKPILGDYYQYDPTPWYKAMWREIRACLYVVPDEDEKNKGVYWFSNKTKYDD